MIKKFSDSSQLAKYLANEILELLQKKNKCVLGCPGGRSLTKTYYQLGRISHKKKISLEKDKSIDLQFFRNSNEKELNIEYDKDIYDKGRLIYKKFLRS